MLSQKGRPARWLAWLGLNLGFYALFLVQVRGYDLNSAGNILAVGALVGLLGVLIVPMIADNVGRRPAGVVAAMCAAVGFLLFALVPLPPLGSMACLALGGIGAGGINSLAGATLPSELVPHRRGASIGVCNLFAATLGITLSPVIGGVLANHFGLLVPVTLAGLVWLVVIGMFLPIPETAPKVLARQGLAPAAPQESVAA